MRSQLGKTTLSVVIIFVFWVWLVSWFMCLLVSFKGSPRSRLTMEIVTNPNITLTFTIRLTTHKWHPSRKQSSNLFFFESWRWHHHQRFAVLNKGQISRTSQLSWERHFWRSPDFGWKDCCWSVHKIHSVVAVNPFSSPSSPQKLLQNVCSPRWWSSVGLVRFGWLAGCCCHDAVRWALIKISF